MSCFKKTYKGKAEAIITDAIILDTVEVIDGKNPPKYFYSNNAIWDTGAEFTIISSHIVKALGLVPCGKAEIIGIGGDQVGNAYNINLALPNGDVIQDLTVFSSDILDYDVLIGMDVITLTDFCISSRVDTMFSFRYPSVGNVVIE